MNAEVRGLVDAVVGTPLFFSLLFHVTGIIRWIHVGYSPRPDSVELNDRVMPV